MNFQDLYKKINELNEAGPAPSNQPIYTAQDLVDILSGKKTQAQVDAEKKSPQSTQGKTPPYVPPSSKAGQPMSFDDLTNMVNKGGKATTTAPSELDQYKSDQAAQWNALSPEEKAKRNMRESMEECGMMPMPVDRGQPDSVSMNVSMNASGAGGIKELMSILKNIESGATAPAPHGHAPHDADALFGDGNEIEMPLGDGYENSQDGAPDAKVFDLDAVTGTGDDLASKGDLAPDYSGPGNNALRKNLQSMYEEIKNR